MDSSLKLFIGLFFSSCGLAYFVYGRKQRQLVPTLTGVVLMVYPYFVTHAALLVILGLAGLGIPWVFRD